MIRALFSVLFRHRRAIFRAAAALALLALVWHLVTTRGYRQATGTYIAGGGRYFIKIDKGFLYGTLSVDEGLILDEGLKEIGVRDFHRDGKGSYSTSSYNQSAYSRHRHLFIEQSAGEESCGIAEDLHEIAWSTNGSQYRLRLELAPSVTMPGDWDLIDAKIASGLCIRHDFSWHNWKNLFAARSLHSAYLQCVGLFGIDQISSLKLDPPQGPIKSFLHRLDDERVIPYFKARMDGDTTHTLAMIRELAALYPADPYLVPHQIELESRRGDYTQADALMKRWEPFIGKLPDMMLRDSFETARRWHDFARLRREKAGLPPLESLLSIPEYDKEFQLRPTRMDLKAQRQWMAQSYMDGLIPIQPRPLVEPCFYQDLDKYRGPEPPDDAARRLGALTDRTRQFYTLAMFDLFSGNRDESLKLLANCYLIGEEIPKGEYEGVWIQDTALKGLTILALNACESPAECQKLKSVLDHLHSLPNDAGYWFGFRPASLYPLMRTTEQMDEFIQEWDTQQKRLKTEIELLRMAVAARAILLATGDFPTSSTQLAPKITGGIPSDPFLASAPLKYKKGDGEALIYSSGPDGRDDHGDLLYDPTNGTASGGDQALHIPRQPRYPFPSEPVHAASATELYRQFPHGLPGDAFDHFKKALKVLDSTGTLPVVIFSARPAFMDSPDKLPTAGRPIYEDPRTSSSRSKIWSLAAPYDPTNGNYSMGDLYLELPK